MSLQLTGKVIKYYPTESGNGAKGEWKKKIFILETQDQYPKKIAFEAWGKVADYFEKIQVSQEVTVHFNTESREYNDKWHTSNKAWKIEVVSNKPLASSYPDEMETHW